MLCVQEALVVESSVRTEKRRFLVVATNVKNLQSGNNKRQMLSVLTFHWRPTAHLMGGW